ncbi:MAG: class I SAM-dependent methyltransferase [bacterium]|nr:class I SAM-dependent methyltransferase [bacterium]
MKNNKEIKILCSQDWQDYELLDTGDRQKLERFGKYIFVRPFEDAVWGKTLDTKEWDKVDGKFWSTKAGAKGGWKMNNKIEDKWEMNYKGIKFYASPTAFRHLSFFPEQASHWDFIEKKISDVGRRGISDVQRPKFLNLFGYTGVASLFALRAGAEVTHVDASKISLAELKENQKLNYNNLDSNNNKLDLDKLPLRIIPDDVIKFLEREIKRGNKYDAIIMDPPKFGRGPKGEVWDIAKELPKLLELVKKVLSDTPLFVIFTSYSTDTSSLSFSYMLENSMRDFAGKVQAGELCVLETSNSRTIPLANTAIWQK